MQTVPFLAVVLGAVATFAQAAPPPDEERAASAPPALARGADVEGPRPGHPASGPTLVAAPGRRARPRPRASELGSRDAFGREPDPVELRLQAELLEHQKRQSELAREIVRIRRDGTPWERYWADEATYDGTPGLRHLIDDAERAADGCVRTHPEGDAGRVVRWTLWMGPRRLFAEIGCDVRGVGGGPSPREDGFSYLDDTQVEVIERALPKRPGELRVLDRGESALRAGEAWTLDALGGVRASAHLAPAGPRFSRIEVALRCCTSRGLGFAPRSWVILPHGGAFLVATSRQLTGGASDDDLAYLMLAVGAPGSDVPPYSPSGWASAGPEADEVEPSVPGSREG